MCFYQRLLFSCGHHHCKIERACKRKNSLGHPCHDKQFKNILEDHICLPCLGKTDAVNCTTEDVLKSENYGPYLPEERNAGVESQRECVTRPSQVMSKGCIEPTNVSVGLRPKSSPVNIAELDEGENIGNNKPFATKTSGSCSGTSHSLTALTPRRLNPDHSAPQYLSRVSVGQMMSSTVEDSVSFSSSLPSTLTEHTSMTTKSRSAIGKVNTAIFSSQSGNSGITAQQPMEGDSISSPSSTPRASLMKYEYPVSSELDPNLQRLCDEPPCGVSAVHRPQGGQKAVSRLFVPIYLSALAIPSFEHAMSRICNFSAGKPATRCITSTGLPSLKLCEPPLEEGKSRVRWKCRCGRRMYDDYIEKRPGAAEELATWLNGNVTRRPVADQNQSRSHSTTTAASESSGLIHLTQQPTHLGIQSQRSSSACHDSCPHHRKEGSTTMECDPECRWLLVCARSKKRPPILSQLKVCSTHSDTQLYRELKHSYSTLRGKYTQLLSLRGVKSIRFVQVSQDLVPR
ncbi:hypothetical protein N7G274_008949 [Stereocaulon virgatum]|uniref:Uncharacterized protein n=1 Tax=Stereocaulon virgatum TaxID=373712 RepID=A0ABR3ZXG0_9LECA